MIRAALYARVSTGHQDAGLQLDELRQVAALRGWAVVAEHVDQGVSGARARRPALDQLRADVQAGRVDLVAVWRLDRLGRSTVDLLHVLQELTAAGVAFVSLRDSGIDTSTAVGRMLVTLLAAFAAFERELTRERSMAGQARARAAGVHVGRPRRNLDQAQASAEFAHTGSVRATARVLGVPEATLRRRLRGASKAPPTGVHEKQPSTDV